MPDLFVAPEQPINKGESAAPEVLDTAPKVSAPALLTDHNPHLFTAYCENPDSVKFADAEPGERILLFLRRHFITNIPWIFFTALLLIAPFILNFVVKAFNIDVSFLPNHSVMFLTIFYYLLVFAYALVSFFTWFFNISLITQKRVIDIDFSDLVYKNVAATKLDLVQDASFSQIGVIRSVFDYGDVLIQTAGAMDNFDLKAVPNPERVIQIVESLIGKVDENV